MEITSYTPQQFSIDPTIRCTQSNNDYYITVFPLEPRKKDVPTVPSHLGRFTFQGNWAAAFPNIFEIGDFSIISPSSLVLPYCIKIIINYSVSYHVFSRKPISEWMQQLSRSELNNTHDNFSYIIVSGDGTIIVHISNTGGPSLLSIFNA